MADGKKHVADARECALMWDIESLVFKSGFNGQSVEITITFKDVDMKGNSASYTFGDGGIFEDV